MVHFNLLESPFMSSYIKVHSSLDMHLCSKYYVLFTSISFAWCDRHPIWLDYFFTVHRAQNVSWTGILLPFKWHKTFSINIYPEWFLTLKKWNRCQMPQKHSSDFGRWGNEIAISSPLTKFSFIYFFLSCLPPWCLCGGMLFLMYKHTWRKIKYRQFKPRKYFPTVHSKEIQMTMKVMMRGWLIGRKGRENKFHLWCL